MPATNRLKNQHLLWRSAFGPMAENAAGLENVSTKTLWQLLLKTSAKKPEKIIVANNLFDGLFKGIQDIAGIQKSQLTSDQKKQLRQQYKNDVKNLNITWLQEMINSEAQLREKMSLFWHGHFACRVINSYFQQELLHVIRENALGNFGDLLKAVSKSAGMLQFLNNQQNRKKHPNENFAREVMELFTLGRGNYTENDIKEAARAFTGWGFNIKGEFEFRKFQHDNDNKTFFGKTGNFNGNDILDLLLKNKQTAIFITKKIYRYFVNENIDTAKVEWLANRFYQNNYDIQSLLTDIYTSDWFYEEKNIGNKIKSPVELIAGMQRLLPLELKNNGIQLLLQKLLGQILFYPPNVAGWPGGKNWIDSSTLMLRLRIPQIITGNGMVAATPKSDDDIMMGQNSQENQKNTTATIQWDVVNKIFEQTSREDLLNTISKTLLQTKTNLKIDNYVNSGNRENFIKSAIISLMSTPEYQLC